MKYMRKFAILFAIILPALMFTAAYAQTWEWEIYAGQHHYVGTLTATETADGLEVTYDADSLAWCFYVTHLYVGSTPLASGAPGQFNYKHENLNCTKKDTFLIPNVSGTVYIAAHAEVGPAEVDESFEVVVTDDLIAEIGNTTEMVVFSDDDSYFDALLSTVAGTYNAWCVDRYNLIYTGRTYAGEVHITTNPDIAAGVVGRPENLDLVNWILNQDYLAQGYTANEIQDAIWLVIEQSYTPETAAGAEIAAMALANGDGFQPTCGQKFGVIVEPTGADNAQHILLEFTVPCETEYTLKPVSGSGETAWALGDTLTEFPRGTGWGGYFEITLTGASSSASTDYTNALSTDSIEQPIRKGKQGNNGNAANNGNGNNSSNNNGNAANNSSNNPNNNSNQQPVPGSIVVPDERGGTRPPAGERAVEDVPNVISLSACSVTTNYMLTLREGPGTAYDDIRQIPYGATLSASSRSGNWYYVTYSSSYGTWSGWISGAANYLSFNGNCR